MVDSILSYLRPPEETSDAQRARLAGGLAAIPGAPQSVLEWAIRHRRIEGLPFSLDRFPPLRDIYADPHPHICVMKPSQRGISEWAINYACFALELGAAAWAPHKDGLNVAIVFPTQDALGDFSKERISGLRLESAYLSALFGDAEFDAVRFKQVGKSYLYLRGGWSESALLSFPADVLILDEYDRIDPGAISLARRRLGASEVRRQLEISTPTIPGRGIHARYLQSDQRVYEQQCPACQIWHVWDFFEDLRADGQPWSTAAPNVPETGWRTWEAERLRRARLYLECPACRRQLTDQERCRAGRWTARAPDIEGLRGYHVPWAAFPFVRLEELAVAAVSQEPHEQEEFYRSDLGVPYDAAGSRITREQLQRLSADLPGGQLPQQEWGQTTMGVDVGSRFHYRVSSLDSKGIAHVRAAGAVRTWAELDALMARYGVRLCCIDALPEQHGAAAWQDRHAGRILRAFYPSTATALQGALYKLNRDEGLLNINRSAAMDALYAQISQGQERWPAALHNDPEIVAHLTAPVRVTTEDQHGQERAEWVHTSPDHLFHASVYDLIARRELAGQAPQFVAPQGLTGESRWR